MRTKRFDCAALREAWAKRDRNTLLARIWPLDRVLPTFVATLVSVVTLGTGRTTAQGIVHLVIFAAFLFLAVVP